MPFIMIPFLLQVWLRRVCHIQWTGFPETLASSNKRLSCPHLAIFDRSILEGSPFNSFRTFLGTPTIESNGARVSIRVQCNIPLLAIIVRIKPSKTNTCARRENIISSQEMREQTQTFATSLLDHARTSLELEIMLNYNPDGDNWEPGERQTLDRLKLAIKYKQKQVIHFRVWNRKFNAITEWNIW